MSNLLENERVQVSCLSNSRLRRCLEVLLLKFASDRVLVAEDEVDLGARAGQVRPEHDCPRRLVIELLATRLEAILKELDVTATTITAVLVLHLILDNERLVGEVDCRLERLG